MKRRHSILSVLALLSLLGLMLPASLWAQLAQGSITGLVKDPSGALIAGATVTITNQGTGGAVVVRSQPDGFYLAPSLQPDIYRVSGEAAGFKRLTIDGLKLDVGTALTQDLNLEVGAVTQTVTVMGTTSLVETTSNTVGSTIAVQPLLNLPLQDRYIYNLANLSPGAWFRSYDDNPVNIRLSSVSLGGSRPQLSLTLIDGIDNTRGDMMGPMTEEMEPPPDAVQEFRVQISNLSPMYSRTGGGVMNTVIKGGSNHLHGDLYEFLRSDKTSAAGWNVAKGAKPPLHRNFFGGTVGGPVKRDKAFFFIAFEDTVNHQGYSGFDSVGLPAWYSGNFTTATRDVGNGTAALVPIYDPTTGQQFQCNGVLNVICSNRINPVATQWMKLANMPYTPNITPTDPLNNTGNYAEVTMAPYHREFYIGRWDENLGTKDKIFARYMGMFDRNYLIGIGYGPKWGVVGGGQNNPSRTQNFVLNWTHIFSPTFFVSASTGGIRLNIITGNFEGTTNYPPMFGFVNNVSTMAPAMLFTGGYLGVSAPSGNPPYQDQFGTYLNNFANFTKVVGRNNFTFGGEYDHFNANLYHWTTDGGFTFNGGYTAQWVNGLQQANTGANLADFLLGDYSAVSASNNPTFGRRAYVLAGYFNDDLRVTRNLTLNLGVRYESTSPVSSPYNRFQNFDPTVLNPLAGTGSGNTAINPGQLGITTFMGLNGQGKYLWNWATGVMPRVGFAYRLFGRSDWAIRGGYGLFLINPVLQAGTLGNNLGFAQSYSASFTPYTNPSPNVTAGLPLAATLLPPVSALTATFGDVGTQYAQSSMSFYYPHTVIPYTQNLNLSLQHQWKDSLIEVGYIGNLGRKLNGGSPNINLVPPSMLAQTKTTAVRLLRPYTQFTGSNASVTLIDPDWGNSDYNALTVSLKHNYKNGLMWTAAYTWSKWMDNISDATNAGVNVGGSEGIQNPYNISGEKARADDDIPWRLVFSPLWELPVGKGKHFLNQGGVLNQVLGGWSVSAMGTYQSGSPFGVTVNNGGSSLGDPNYTLRADEVAPPYSPNKWQPATGGVIGIQYLNPAAFIGPSNAAGSAFPYYTLGMTSRTLPNINGPGLANMNIEIAKNWYYRERYRLNFQCNALDVFNTPYLSGSSTFADGAPNYTLGAANFGLLTSQSWQGNQRRILEFALKLYF